MAFPSDLTRSKNWGTEILTDTDLEAQLDLIINWIMAALDSTTGHAHTGVANKSPKINVADGLTVTNQAQGDVLYASSAAAFARLAVGTKGKCLTTGGAAANPSWEGMTTQGDIEYHDGTSRARLGVGTDGQVLKTQGAAANPIWYTLPVIDYIKVSDVKVQNTAGGTFTLGAWRTRTINTEDTDTGNHCSIAGNQITLAAGTYECLIRCPGYCSDEHQARLYNITDGSTTLLGSSAYSRTGSLVMMDSIIQGRFTIAAQKVFEVQHYSLGTQATTGFGRPANIDSEVYTVAEFRKVA
jgi:hypothetical protein